MKVFKWLGGLVGLYIVFVVVFEAGSRLVCAGAGKSASAGQHRRY